MRLFELLESCSLSLGRWFSIPVTLHWSWLLLFGFVLFTSPKFAVVYATVFFIVLLHEFGHCLAGRYYDMHVGDITLYPIGGVARMEIPIKPHQELVVALAGPAVNAALMPVFWTLLSFPQFQHESLQQISWINTILLVFNLLPAYPMDGGRVLRSLLAMCFDDHNKATVVAGRISQGVCILLAVLGIYFGNFMIAIIGAVIFFAAQNEISRVADARQLVNLYQSMTGNSPQKVSYADVEASAKMIEEIDKRLAALNSNQPPDNE